ncbi:hypothetical protein SBA5_70159 [Candidatus Sulfotelmatomonas gaucii]|uniref:Uncharacterized protein n=1 Tax=Candidatus Sulfuritelmatomonas gaucii TaxID=2043161 RepID=A0A2N9M0V9_9BACT|nr:hypothetical protein SBA5_70159 [Candidatus Sulfotelmatomonas gaucii]
MRDNLLPNVCAKFDDTKMLAVAQAVIEVNLGSTPASNSYS